MADALKEMFNIKFYELLVDQLASQNKNFKAKSFLIDIQSNLEELSLNQRLRNTSVQMHRHLNCDFKKTIEQFKYVIEKMPTGYTNLIFPDYVALYGKEHFELSLEALKHFTRFGSSEFAIREFLKLDFKKTIFVMEQWASDKNHHVRRLSSEGSRPRLPWSFKLDEIIKNPKHTSPILETLKNDKELYVRKSVANHLNDISKDNPEYMMALIKKWDQSSIETAWIIKHASRSLIKQGNEKSLAIFNYEKNPKFELKNFKVNSKTIKLGENLSFSFEIISEKKASQKLVIDYIIYYRKKSGELSPKVFKLKELDLAPFGKIEIKKNQQLKDFTTRKHYAGRHKLAIQINGKVVYETEFNLLIGAMKN